MTAWSEVRRLLPGAGDYAGASKSWRTDVAAGITVGVVALPLALAFGIAAGLGARAGLITAIVAGAVAGLLGGSNVQVSGPTGAMAVVLAPIVVHHGRNGVLVAGLMAGVLITAAGIGRLGRWLAFVPWPVIEGFTVGIALIIFCQQVPNALGVSNPGGTNAAASAAKAGWRALHGSGGGTAIVIVLGVAALMVVLPRLHRSLPSSLLAVVAATVGVKLSGASVATIGSLPRSLPRPSIPHVTFTSARDLVGAAFAIAVLAALESLLSAKVADGMCDAPRHDPDRELFGQGIANLVSPLFGGMPATGAIARTAVNVRAGARTRIAALVHAAVLLLVVLVGSGLVSRIPMAALAGVLMVTAVRMIERHNVAAVLRATRSDAVVLVATAGVTVAFDLIAAVEVGVAMAAALALRQMAKTATAVSDRVEVDPATREQLMHRHIVTYRLDGAMFFGAAQRFLTEMTAVSDVEVVILRLPDLQVLDATGASALKEIIAELEGRGVTVLLKAPRPEHLRTLTAVGAIDRLATERHIFADLDGAIAHAQFHVGRAASARAT